MAEIPGSFRDPSGFLFRHQGIVYRQVNEVYASDYDRMVQSGFLASAVADRLLIAHEEVDLGVTESEVRAYKTLRPEQLPFVSYPYEWSFSQLKDAALLTLQLQRRALEHGLWLKDASAYNVQFLRGRPIFIDTLSFEAYPEGRPWVAYQQFCRHFLAPLALMAYTHVDLHKLLRLNVDGVPLDLASRLLPARTRLRFSLLTHIHLHGKAQKDFGDTRESADRANRSTVSRNAMIGLVDSLRSAVHHLRWTPGGTEWGDYYSDTNYSDAASRHKAESVARMIDAAAPSTVWDLGANTGVFSRVVSQRGIPTVAFDVDPAAVEKNYLSCRAEEEELLLPLVMDLTNPSPGIGWDGRERASLFERSPADCVLALALIHHLAIGNNVPLPRAADCLQRLGRKLVIEFVPKGDSQLQRMLAARKDVFPDYTQKGFEAAFERRFELRERIAIEDTERTLYLFERRDRGAEGTA